MSHLLHPDNDAKIKLAVTPESAGWDWLDFSVVALKAGDTIEMATEGREVALVPLRGAGVVEAGGARFELSRRGVFDEKPHVLYVPPGETIRAASDGEFEFALGGAPAEGKYPLRLFHPHELRTELRGGGAANRQVVHILSHPLPAERLILFEVYVTGGNWSGWPPHCHDGYGGSAHLDEVYYFRTDPDTGYTIHRNYRLDNDFNELYAAYDGDLVLVTQGFHSTAPAPNCNLYFLNYLAGELYDDARSTPPYDDPAFAYIKEDWTAHTRSLPIIGG